ncbi:methionine synthase I [Halovulum dunhuangense]|uniref:Methionine synthase I n=1 Tax=Halovulum dunhuangense TaxID=1505036 RepID=A0A849L2Q1_9RHOB|nr:holin family protein [Halovulum dunhuangense]NNU80565.1 methionine synthase I [Halovulum dunhuangense]
MGLIARLLGLAPAVTGVAEVFVANRTQQARQDHEAQIESLRQMGAEFARPERGWFDRLVDGLNRLPRPALAIGTLGLFAFAMADPVAFGVRMQGLALVPEPLWWLLGAIVSFYFGARELHHIRSAVPGPDAVRATVGNIATLRALEDEAPVSSTENPAVAEWRAAAR